MVEKISCAKCIMLLYYGEEIKRRLCMRAIPSETTVLGFYNNVCPKCGNKLSLPTVRMEIKEGPEWHTVKS